MTALAAHQLIDLAHRRDQADRDRLLMAVVDLCSSSDDARRPELRGLLDDVFSTLVIQTERDIRKSLAERLSTADWAPKALIETLARDEIEIARPVILASPLLDDDDLLRLLIEAAVEHQIEVARRPDIGARVVEAILDRAEPSVLAALAANGTADVDEDALRRLVAASRRIAALRAPLARHPRLTQPLALQLYAWVGEALRSSLSQRFQVDREALGLAVSNAVNEAHATPSPIDPSLIEYEAERRLVAKLEQAGELRPGYLVRALKDGKLGLFQAALCALGKFTPAEVRKACMASDPELLALACAAVGIDRVVFPSLLMALRETNTGRPGGGSEAGKRTAAAFSRSPESAGRAFRDLAQGV